MMTSKFALLFFVLFGLAPSFSRAQEEIVTAPQENGEIILKIGRLRSQKGGVGIAVFGDRDSFPRKGDKAVLSKYAELPESGALEVRLGPLPYGTYAIAIFHDEDGDKKMGTFMGLPKEGYGFSNDAAVLFGPPSFSSAKFSLDSSEKPLEINVRYMF